MDRALRANVITKSGKAVETAGDIDTLLLDKTGTITIGNRKATHFHTAPGIDLHAFCRKLSAFFLCPMKLRRQINRRTDVNQYPYAQPEYDRRTND